MGNVERYIPATQTNCPKLLAHGLSHFIPGEPQNRATASSPAQIVTTRQAFGHALVSPVVYGQLWKAVSSEGQPIIMFPPALA